MSRFDESQNEFSRGKFAANNASERRPRPRFNRADHVGRNTSSNEGHRYVQVKYDGSNNSNIGTNRKQNFNSDGNRKSFSNRPQRQQSSNPNMKYSNRKQFEYHQSEVDLNKPMRLNKYLANAGICSRREADEFIQAGVITVNGEVVTTLGTKVMPTDKIMFHDQPVRSERKVYVLLNKPKNTITTTEDPEERNTVMNIVKNVCSERIYPVGRLDRNTTGVLLLTNDGDLAAKLTHPKYGKKKTYQAKLDKPLTQEDYDIIMKGVTLDDELIVPDDMQYLVDNDHVHIGLTIHSGQNRVVRRIFERVGYKVLKLDRTVFAGLTKKNLGRGKFRFLTPKEVAMLKMGAFE